MTQPLVAVFLGTDHHRFDRLMGWVSQLAARGDMDWFVQSGYTALPADLTGSSMLAVSELEGLLERADVVVTHGGPGLIMEARAAGHVPVVVPRNPAYDEHVDGHQLKFTARIAADGMITMVHELDDLDAAVRRAAGAGPRIPQQRQPEPTLANRFGDLVETLMHPV